jgi:putative membrane protein
MCTTSWAVRASIAAVACATLAACGKRQGDRSAGTADTGPAATSSAGARSDSAAATSSAGGEAGMNATTAPLSDANILALISEANNAEIQAAQMAETKASTPPVRAFAQLMIHDHRQMQAQGDQVAKAINVTPQPPANDTLAAHVQQEQSQLSPLSKGPDFDRAYINDQVADHQTVLAMLHQFESEAQAAQLKMLIEKAIPKVQSHLDRAQKLQSTLGAAA